MTPPSYGCLMALLAPFWARSRVICFYVLGTFLPALRAHARRTRIPESGIKTRPELYTPHDAGHTSLARVLSARNWESHASTSTQATRARARPSTATTLCHAPER